MALHPALQDHAGLRHVRKLDKALQAVEAELTALGIADGEVDLERYSADKGMLRRLFEGIDPNTIDQCLIIRCQYQSMAVEVILSMINSGWLLPLQLCFELPVSVDLRAECRRSALGRKWVSTPENKDLTRKLDKVLPAVRKNHNWVALFSKLKTFYVLEPLEQGGMGLFVQTGFKRGMFDRPKLGMAPYFRAATEARDILSSMEE